MPYELTCPSCSLAVTSSFVRVGAVVACSRCGQVYRIGDAHVRRKSAAAVGVAAATDPEQPLQIPEPSTEELIERATDGQIIGLSGLSEMMRQVPTSGDPAAPPPAAGLIRSATTPRPRGGQAARQTARRRSARMLYGLLAGFVLFMATIGGGLWYIMAAGRIPAPYTNPPPPPEHPTGVEPGPAPNDPSNPSPPSPFEALPLLEATPLPPPAWERVDRPHDYRYHPSIAWLTDHARVFTENAEEHYVASVVTDSPAIVVDATVHLTLVLTETSIAVAEADLPMMLFGRDRRQRMRVTLARGLPDGLLSVDGWVEVHETFEGGIYLSQPTAEPVPDAAEPTLVVSAVNLGERPIQRSVFLVTAQDARARPLARWRVDVAQEAAPRESVEFRLRLPPPMPNPADIAQWDVEAAGQ